MSPMATGDVVLDPGRFIVAVSYGVLSTYPPTQCGLASFSKALVDSLRSPDDVVGVVRVLDAREPSAFPEVIHQWVRGEIGGSIAASAALNAHDVAIVQHEYGIFAGRDGADVLEVVRALWVPTIVVLHTVLTTPTPHQREILEEIVRLCVTVVTMTQTARTRLIAHYKVDADKIRVVPHGAAENKAAGPGEVRSPATSPVVLTWGLLGEGKGIEWAIDAMAQLRDLRPALRYSVVGQTHPRVLERHGERYRDSLTHRARELGVADAVDFDARYIERTELQRLVQRADVVLLPYDSVEQVTSGVLIEAVTAGKPVVSTGFPHAAELLASGAGLIVERQDPAAIAQAVRRVLTEPGLAASMAAESRRITPELLWPAVADQYREVAAHALRKESVFATG
jgi:glycosyltransferase involved in cell wall biosynthesis